MAKESVGRRHVVLSRPATFLTFRLLSGKTGRLSRQYSESQSSNAATVHGEMRSSVSSLHRPVHSRQTNSAFDLIFDLEETLWRLESSSTKTSLASPAPLSGSLRASNRIRHEAAVHVGNLGHSSE